jgi:hypothetical protein
MTPPELGTLIDTHMSMCFGEDRMIDINAVVDAVMASMPLGETVNRDLVRQSVMARGIGYAGMRW